jgi:hypothetical protein
MAFSNSQTEKRGFQFAFSLSKDCVFQQAAKAISDY